MHALLTTLTMKPPQWGQKDWARPSTRGEGTFISPWHLKSNFLESCELSAKVAKQLARHLATLILTLKRKKLQHDWSKAGQGAFSICLWIWSCRLLISNCNCYYFSLFVIYMKSSPIINMKIIFYLLSYLSFNSHGVCFLRWLDHVIIGVVIYF